MTNAECLAFAEKLIQSNPEIGRRKLSRISGISESKARRLLENYRKDRVLRGVFVGDIHYPFHNRRCMKILFGFLADFQPDYFGLMGDQLDLDMISTHTKGKLKLLEERRIFKDYKGFQKDVLNVLDDILKDDCKKWFVIGNHEDRVDRLLDEEPRWEGGMEIENNLDLEDYTIIKYNDSIEIGEMEFIHGDPCNEFHAKKNLMTYGSNIFNWHVHTNQVYTMQSPSRRLPKQGVSIGCLCDKNPHYMRNKPSRWVHQFLFFHMFEDGTFTYYTPIIINGKTVINNKVFI